MEFNPDNLMHTEVDGASSTNIVPVPEGEWEGTLGAPKFRQAEIKKGERAGEMLTFMDIMIGFAGEPEVVEACKRDNPSVRHSVIMTLTPDGSGISTEEGDNIDFGRLREACGLNEEGIQFTPAMFEGCRVKVIIKHTPDAQDPETVYANVRGVKAA